MRPDEAAGTIIAFLALTAVCALANTDEVAPVVIFQPAPGDTFIWGQGLPDETVCVATPAEQVCTVPNPYGVWGAFPFTPLEPGWTVRAWGSYSPESSIVVMEYRVFASVVMR